MTKPNKDYPESYGWDVKTITSPGPVTFTWDGSAYPGGTPDQADWGTYTFEVYAYEYNTGEMYFNNWDDWFYYKWPYCLGDGGHNVWREGSGNPDDDTEQELRCNYRLVDYAFSNYPSRYSTDAELELIAIGPDLNEKGKPVKGETQIDYLYNGIDEDGDGVKDGIFMTTINTRNEYDGIWRVLFRGSDSCWIAYRRDHQPSVMLSYNAPTGTIIHMQACVRTPSLTVNERRQFGMDISQKCVSIAWNGRVGQWHRNYHIVRPLIIGTPYINVNLTATQMRTQLLNLGTGNPPVPRTPPMGRLTGDGNIFAYNGHGVPGAIDGSGNTALTIPGFVVPPGSGYTLIGLPTVPPGPRLPLIDLELVVLVACSSAEVPATPAGATSIAQHMVNLGAKNAVGFRDIPDTAGTGYHVLPQAVGNIWTLRFWHLYMRGEFSVPVTVGGGVYVPVNRWDESAAYHPGGLNVRPWRLGTTHWKRFTLSEAVSTAEERAYAWLVSGAGRGQGVVADYDPAWNAWNLADNTLCEIF